MKKIAVVIAALVAVLLAFPLRVEASLGELDAGFVVSAVLPENQSAPEAGSFDLLMRPGQEQELAVDIENPNSEPITVTVEAIAASTNRNGLILYSAPGIYDDSMEHSFSDIAQVVEEEIIIPPHSTAQGIVKVTMPEETFDGLMLGAIRVLRLPTQKELEETGVINQFSYAIAVRLRETDTVIQPAFSLGSAGVELMNYKAALFVHIRNPQPLLVEGASVEARIYQDGQLIIENALEEVDIAPNSVFPFTLTDQQGYGFAPGNYTAQVSLAYQGENWELETDFTVEPQQAQAINSNALNQFQQEKQGTPVWVIAIVAASALFLGAQGTLMLYRRRQQKR